MQRLTIFLILFLMVINIAAQESDSWQIIERCVDEPAAPPDDWSFDGVIFMYTWRAVHGLNTHIDTPYIIAYNNKRNSFALNGTVSPDGRWFAVPTGTGRPAGFITWHFEVERIHVYSTDGRRTRYTVDTNSPIYFGSDIPYYEVDIPQWLNDEEFIFPVMGNVMERINPFSGTREPYNGDYRRNSLLDVNKLGQDDERWILSQELFRDGNIFAGVTANPYDTHFAVQINENTLIGDTSTQIFTDLCIQSTGVAIAPSGEIVLSTGEEILLIQEDTTYRLAYHDGRVFDWRFPDND